MHPSRPGKAAPGLLLVAFLLAACAGVPYQEMSDARQAVEAARPVVMDQPAEREQVQRAHALLQRAEAELHAGDYAAARKLAEQARDLAIDARVSAEQGQD